MPQVKASVNAARLQKLVGKAIEGSPQFERALRTRVMRVKQQESAQAAQAYYRGMLGAVSDVLANPGVPSITTSGVKSRGVQVRLGPGAGIRASRFNAPFRLASGRDGDQPWNRLTDGYIWRKPWSKTFWRKRETGSLHRLFVADLSGRTVISSLPAYTQKALKPVNRVGPAHYQGRFTLTFPALHPGIDPLLRPAFVGGVIRPLSGRGARRDNLEVVRYPEFYRPWLSRLAKTAGRQMRQTIASL